MARLDEIAEGLATLLGSQPRPEPLGVDLIGESPADTTVLVRAVIDACERRGRPIYMVQVSEDLGKGLSRQLEDTNGRYQGVYVQLDPELQGRVEFFRSPPLANQS